MLRPPLALASMYLSALLLAFAMNAQAQPKADDAKAPPPPPSEATEVDGPDDDDVEEFVPPPPPPREGRMRGEKGAGGWQHRRRDRGERPDRMGRGGRREGHMGRMGKFLGFVEHYIRTVQDQRQAVGLAALAIKDHYRKSGKATDAIPLFEEQLARTKDQPTRNVLLFAIRHIYEEARDEQRFLEINKQILRENVQAGGKN